MEPHKFILNLNPKDNPIDNLLFKKRFDKLSKKLGEEARNLNKKIADTGMALSMKRSKSYERSYEADYLMSMSYYNNSGLKEDFNELWHRAMKISDSVTTTSCYYQGEYYENFVIIVNELLPRTNVGGIIESIPSSIRKSNRDSGINIFISWSDKKRNIKK